IIAGTCQFFQSKRVDNTFGKLNVNRRYGMYLISGFGKIVGYRIDETFAFNQALLKEKRVVAGKSGMRHTVFTQNGQINRGQNLWVGDTGAYFKFLVLYCSPYCRIAAIIKQGAVIELELENCGCFEDVPVGKGITHVKTVAPPVKQKFPFDPVRHLLQRHHIDLTVEPVRTVRKFYISR